MAQQTEVQAVEALTQHLGVDELDLSQWSISRWRDAHLIVSTQLHHEAPLYLVLNGRVGQLDFTNASIELSYVKLAGA